MDPQESDCNEACSITFEWTIRNLKHLFDSSKGDAKSKAVKSPKFGGGRWQASGMFCLCCCLLDFLLIDPVLCERWYAEGGCWRSRGWRIHQLVFGV